MNTPVKTTVSIVTTALWITLSEFVRNELLFKSYWTNHYQSLGLEFPSEPVNGMLWGLWSLVFAGYMFIISRGFSFRASVGISWISGFVLMWLVIGNMGVLPIGILTFAVPLSILEVLVAQLIIRKISPFSVERDAK